MIYGTDFTLPAETDDVRASDNLTAQHNRDWQLLSSAETLTYNRRQVKGFMLPRRVLKNIFRENALRWFPGLT